MITSKLTSNCRTTIPERVREALNLCVGDKIAYVISEDHVVIAKAPPVTIADPFVSFEEWAGEADSTAYAEL